MPVHKCGPSCEQYGKHGKKYRGPTAKAKAQKQATAVAFSKARAAGRSKPTGRDYR
jgi:hypothetical protein